jgi:hypothetical protein
MYLDYDWIDLVDVHVRGAARDEVTDANGVTAVGEGSVGPRRDGRRTDHDRFDLDPGADITE